VLRNPHARRLLWVFGVQQTGVALATIGLPYLSEYGWSTAEWTAGYLLMLFATSLIGVPLWLRAAPGLDKARAMRVSMLGVALAIAALGAVPPLAALWVLALAALGGLAAAGMDVLGPSLQADIIDWDELRTGERKEGVYFSAWAFVQKSAFALGQALAGVSLALIGFVPNAAQTASTTLGLRVLTGVLPAGAFALGLLGFRRFALSAQELARIQRELATRSAATAN
jgi:GPH family glycoside/pentoside/hexuronide:cation symporter